MNSSFSNYQLSLYKAVLRGMQIEEAPLSFSERIHEAIQPYLRPEYQRPQPSLPEV